jgi:hypothetical protein
MKLLARFLLLAALIAGLLGSESHPGDTTSGIGGAEAAAPQQEDATRPKTTRDDDIERFEPSEEVPAASAVSFPVDI